jgi:hypothetical protein
MGLVHVTGSSNRVVAHVGDFVANLPEMLGAMAADPRCLVAIVDFADDRYVQFWVAPDGAVIGEVISNVNCGDVVALSGENENALRHLGWEEPSEFSPNWRVQSHDVAGLVTLVNMMRDVVFEVLGEKSENPMWLRSWSVKGDVEVFAATCAASSTPLND